MSENELRDRIDSLSGQALEIARGRRLFKVLALLKCLGVPSGFERDPEVQRLASLGLEGMADEVVRAYFPPDKWPADRLTALRIVLRPGSTGRRIGGIGTGFQGDVPIRFSAGTDDFPHVLADTLSAAFLGIFDAAEPTWPRWGAEVEVDRLGEASTLGWLEPFESLSEKPGDGAPFRKIKATDSGANATVREYGALWTLEYEAITADRLNAFKPLLRLAAATARTEDDAVYGLLALNLGLGPAMADALPLFDAAHNNIVAGAVLSAAALDTARAALAAQTTADGVALYLKARTLLVPVALTSQAATVLREIGNADLPPEERLDLVVEPRLDAISTKAWILAAGAAQYPSLQLAFLEGLREPQTASKVIFDTGNIKFRVRHTFGASIVSWRGIVRNPGA